MRWLRAVFLRAAGRFGKTRRDSDLAGELDANLQVMHPFCILQCRQCAASSRRVWVRSLQVLRYTYVSSIVRPSTTCRPRRARIVVPLSRISPRAR